MIVRAKFRVERIERSMSSRSYRETQDNGQEIWKARPIELHTIVLSPVYSADPANENHKFWDATPSGEIRLGVVNAAAANGFELDKEYYIDFTLAVMETAGTAAA